MKKSCVWTMTFIIWTGFKTYTTIQCNAVPRCHLVIAPRLYEAPTWPHQPTQQNHTKEQVVRVLGFWNFWRSCVWIQSYMCMVFLPGLIKGRLYLNKQAFDCEHSVLWLLWQILFWVWAKFGRTWSASRVKWGSSRLYGFRAGAQHKQLTFMVKLLQKYLRVWNRAPDKSGKCYC